MGAPKRQIQTWINHKKHTIAITYCNIHAALADQTDIYTALHAALFSFSFLGLLLSFLCIIES